MGKCRTSLPSRAISPCRGFVALALEIPEIAGYLKMDEQSQEEVLKYFYLRAGGSFRELQLLLENAAKANASDSHLSKKSRQVRISARRSSSLATVQVFVVFLPTRPGAARRHL